MTTGSWDLPFREAVRLDFVLQVRTTTHIVTVTAEAPMLRTDSSEQGINVSGDPVNDLPLNLGWTSTVTQASVDVEEFSRDEELRRRVRAGRNSNESRCEHGRQPRPKLQLIANAQCEHPQPVRWRRPLQTRDDTTHNAILRIQGCDKPLHDALSTVELLPRTHRRLRC